MFSTGGLKVNYFFGDTGIDFVVMFAYANFGEITDPPPAVKLEALALRVRL